MIQMDLDRMRDITFRKSTVHSQKLTAMALNGKHIVCYETNRRGNGLVSRFSIHAEEFLIKKLRKTNAKNRYNALTVIVMRFRKDGSLGIAKPCVDCHRLLDNYGVKNVYYSINDGLRKL